MKWMMKTAYLPNSISPWKLGHAGLLIYICVVFVSIHETSSMHHNTINKGRLEIGTKVVLGPYVSKNIHVKVFQRPFEYWYESLLYLLIFYVMHARYISKSTSTSLQILSISHYHSSDCFSIYWYLWHMHNKPAKWINWLFFCSRRALFL